MTNARGVDNVRWIMKSATAVDPKAALRDTMSHHESLLVSELVRQVARENRIGVDQVTAALWELIGDDEFTYGADARVSRA